jgi:hypothetical protein
VDGLIGTGLKGDLEGTFYDVVELINRHCEHVISLDIPTGVSGDSGQVQGAAVQAAMTVSFGFPRLGHFLPPGAMYRGKLINVDISLPHVFSTQGDKFLLRAKAIGKKLASRDRYGHKNTFGHVLLMGGSPGRTGAIAMATQAALRSGAGLATAATWSDSMSVLSRQLPIEANPARPTIKPQTISEAALGVPLMCNPGTQEGVTVTEGRFAGVWPANQTFFKAIRSRGGLIGIAIDPLTAHECGNQRYLAIPWLDACLTARLPEQPGAALRPMPTADAWLAPVLATQAVPAPSFSGDPKTAVWLPGEAIAKQWMQYVKDTLVTDATPPPAPGNLKVTGADLSWSAEADLESGLAHFIVERDGQAISTVPAAPKNPFGRPIFQCLQYSDTPATPLVEMRFTDPKPEPGKTHVYRIIAVNTCGLKSS